MGHGPDARTLPGNDRPFVWKRGSNQEVSWGIMVNHGGGYRYSLCKKPTGYRKNLDLTEECFQNGTLNFVGDTQWIEDASRANTGPGKTHNRTAVPALRKSEGTFPPGS